MRSLVFVATLAILSACASSSGGPAPAGPAPAAAPTTVRVVGSGDKAGAITMGMVADGPDQVSRSLAGAVDDIWRVLPAVYEELGIALTTRDAATHQIGNAGFNARRRLGKTPMIRYFDCGSTQGGPSAETYDMHLSVLTSVAPGGAGMSTVTTVVEAAGKPVAFSGEMVRCSSTGALERRIVDGIKEQLKK